MNNALLTSSIDTIKSIATTFLGSLIISFTSPHAASSIINSKFEVAI